MTYLVKNILPSRFLGIRFRSNDGDNPGAQDPEKAGLGTAIPAAASRRGGKTADTQEQLIRMKLARYAQIPASEIFK